MEVPAASLPEHPASRTDALKPDAQMTSMEEIERLRTGQPFIGEIGPFVAPSPEALEQVAAELRRNPSQDVRIQLVKLLVSIAIQTDPHGAISHRRILSILLNDASIAPDDAYRFAMDRLAELGSPRILGEQAPVIARLTFEAPVSELFLVIAKAKAAEAMEAMQELEKDPTWAKDDNFRIALAALGDQSIEDGFVEPFAKTTDPQEKIALAAKLARIGTSTCQETLAASMRSSLILRKPGSYELSVRVEIAKALLFCHPEQTFLGRIESDEEYDRIEKWCEFQFGTRWSSPRPPFLTMRSPAN